MKTVNARNLNQVKGNKSNNLNRMEEFIMTYKFDNIYREQNLSLAEVLFLLEGDSGKTPAQIYSDAGILKTTYHNLICGKVKNPDKQTVLSLALGLKLAEFEMKQFVEFCGYSFPADRRDVILLGYTVTNQWVKQDITSKRYERTQDLQKINNILEEHQCKPLGNRDYSVFLK